MMAHSMAGELIRVGVLMLGLWVQSALRVCNKITIETYEITANKDIKGSSRSIQSSFVLNGFYLILHSGHDLRAGKHTHLTYSLSFRIRRQKVGPVQEDVQRNKERDGSGGEAGREEQQLHRSLLPVCGGKQYGHADVWLAVSVLILCYTRKENGFQ